MEGNPQRGHTNHTSQAPDTEEEEVDLGQEEVTLAVTGDGWPRSRGRFRGGRGGFSHRGRFQGRKFDKSPTTKRPQVSSKAEDKDKD